MLPEVIVGAIEHRSAQGQDGVQPLGSPAHARSLETSSHDSFTRSLDAHTSDPLDSLDPNLASVRTYNHHSPSSGWFTGTPLCSLVFRQGPYLALQMRIL